MKVNIGFAICVDVIEFEPFMGEDMKKYQYAFLDYYGKNIERMTSFTSQTVVDWMNEVAPNCNARVVQKRIYPGKEDTSLPYMYF